MHGGFSKFIEHFRQHGWQEFLDLLKIWNRYASHLPKEATSLPQEADFVQAFRRFRGKFTSVSPDFFIIIFDTFAPEFIVSLISDRAPQVDRRSLVESIVM